MADATTGDAMDGPAPAAKCDCLPRLDDTRTQLTSMEQANETLQRKLEGYVKDNENLVIKYAYVEKKVLDLKALVDEKDAKVKRCEQDIGGLQKQIGALKADKAKLQKNIESKHRDVEQLAKELEGSRHYSSEVEMRFKHGRCRLRKETDDRMRLEAEVLTLRQQLLQHVIAEETHQSSEQVAEMERKLMELQAREIMLKHANEEQTAKVLAIQRANAEMRDAAERQEKKYHGSLQALKESEMERKNLREQMVQLQEGFTRQSAQIAQLEDKVEVAAMAAQESTRMERIVTSQRAELGQLATTLDEHRKDVELLKVRELELLALNKDLSEVNCLLQQEIATQESKTIAITLEYGKFVTMCQEYDAQIVGLANSLAVERQHRTEERLLMAKHIADRTRKHEHAEACLQQTVNELEAHRKKYFALVKDFKREMKNVRDGAETIDSRR